jgi:uncharacterized membrane protein (UPF0127 family)
METTSTLASRTAKLQRQDGRVVCEHLLVAARPLRRMRGLLGRSGLNESEGILLRPAGSIHTFFMRFAIDVVFLDRDLVVIGIEPSLEPWRTAGRRGSKAVVELASGECERRGIEVGDTLTVVA